MIARLWRGRAADAAKADAYVRHFTGTVTAELKGLAGLLLFVLSVLGVIEPAVRSN